MKQLMCIAAFVALAAPPARAQVCEPGGVQDALQYLRRLSLDLRGRLPDVAELEAVVASGRVEPAVIDAMLASEEWIGQVRAYHRDLLWTNLAAQRLAQFAWQLRAPTAQRPAPAYWNPGRALFFRGVQEPCLDEPARFGAAGEILTTPDAARPGVAKEGWVEVQPYWAPATTIRVCALDAQTGATGVDRRGNTVECARTANATGCGCGESLRWCQSSQDGTERAITSAMAEQLLRAIEGVVRDGRPYTEILLGTAVEVNGPLSHYLRHQTGGGGTLVLALPEQGYEVPAVPFAEASTWRAALRSGRHAGILTLPGYLLKFQSDRGRANRFYNAFLCQAFQAPPGGLPAASDGCHDEPDLTKRCGCQYCHVAVEPAAAYWGRWSEAGIIPMDDATFPRFREDCASSRARGIPACRLFYLIEAGHPDEQPYLGQLRPYVFADDQRVAAIEAGPAALARQAVDSGQLASCTARKWWAHLLGREPHDGDAMALAELAEGFAGRYDLRALVRAIVLRDEYRLGERYAAMGEMP